MKIVNKAVICAFLTLVPAAAQMAKQSWVALHEDGYAAFSAARYADALADFETSMPLVSTPRERAMTLSDIGYTLTELGRAAEALAQLEAALALWRSIDPSGHRAQQVAISVGSLERTLGRFREAEQTLRAAIDATSRGNPDHAAALVALGDLLNEQEHFTESRATFEDALKLARARDQTRASALIGLGDAESNGGQLQPAIGHLNEALAISKEIKSPELEALGLRDLGNTYARLGDFASAQPLLRRALAIFETVPLMRAQYAGTLVSLGSIYGAENKRALAEDAYMRALKLYAGGPADLRSALALEYLATIRAQQKRFAEAADFAKRAYAPLKSAFGENSAPAAGALGTVAFVEAEAGDLEQSERDYSAALRILRDGGDPRSNSALAILPGYAKVLRKLHRRREAKMLEQQVKAFHSGHPAPIIMSPAQ
jgi:tetratricopeptide (TPR) repeat protein